MLSLSDQRWSGVHHLLQDLERAVACVVKRRQVPEGGMFDEMKAPRLGRMAPAVSANAVHQDPVACRPLAGSATPTNQSTVSTPAGRPLRNEPLFQRELGSLRQIVPFSRG
eukprot:symbB.v1.2.010484.t1/scaffold674.1/size176181/1